MKQKALIVSVLVVGLLLVASPVLALSLGVSPTQVTLEVPSEGSITTNVQIHYFDGDVQISLIDIPLRIEPETIHVEASENPVVVELTIYGDSSLGSEVYDGYIRFIAVSGGAATGGVQVIAKVTNMVDGVSPVVEMTVPADQTSIPGDTISPVEETDPATEVQDTLPTESQPQSVELTKSQVPLEYMLIGFVALFVLLLVGGLIIRKRRRT